ncbi:MAG TPA: phosphatidylserine decarboxylase family protein [Cytophagales bacterium]|nr:phosphatidylserine decarboxylase family protein [Cytophagales bacterium]
MTIHKEGKILLLVLLIILIVLNIGALAYLPGLKFAQYIILGISLLFWLLILQFFRSPNRNITINEKHVLAPADGKVVVIEEVNETEYFNELRRQISIFMSPVNVHVNRNPITGIIKYFKYHPGQYLVAWHPKSSVLNERTTIVIQHASGIEILFRQIAGALARRIKFYVKEGDVVQQGDEFGFIKFGSRVDVFVPLSAEVKVNIGQKTVGGRTVLAELR